MKTAAAEPNEASKYTMFTETYPETWSAHGPHMDHAGLAIFLHVSPRVKAILPSLWTTPLFCRPHESLLVASTQQLWASSVCNKRVACPPWFTAFAQQRPISGCISDVPIRMQPRCLPIGRNDSITLLSPITHQQVQK